MKLPGAKNTGFYLFLSEKGKYQRILRQGLRTIIKFVIKNYKGVRTDLVQ